MAPIRCCFDQTAVWHSDAARGPSTPSFNHLVGTQQNRRWQLEAKRSGCFEIDDKLYLRRLLDRQMGRLGTVEYFAGIDTGLSVHIKGVDAIAQQTASHRNISAFVNRRKPVTCRQCGQLRASHVEISISGNQQCTDAALADRGERRIDFTFRTGGKNLELQPESLRGGLRSGVDGLRRRAFRVYQNGNRAGTRHDLMQQFKALCRETRVEIAQSGKIATWPP